MAGITDVPFRNIVMEYGAGLVVSEMVASREMVTARPSTRMKAALGLESGRTAVQIAGRDPVWMAECARMCVDLGAPIIDINMGCPAKKVTSGMSGSALMREPDLALSLVEAVVGAVSVPVTLKMRLGWDDQSHNASQIAVRARDAGIQMVTVHGRTRCQFYKGHANWAAVRSVADAVDIPVNVNGDIRCARTARLAMEKSGAHGVMIGRGAQGRPWLLAEVFARLSGKQYMAQPSWIARVALIERHYEAILEFYGRELGVRTARKHLGWYVDALGNCAHLRPMLLRSDDPVSVRRAIRAIAHIDAEPAHAA